MEDQFHELCSRRQVLLFGRGLLAAGVPAAFLTIGPAADAQGVRGDPRRIVSDVIQAEVNRKRGAIERAIKAELGRPNLLGRGYTLTRINFRLGQPNFRFTSATHFDYRLNRNYLYCRSTTPSVFGSYADPAFEIHFDASLAGALIVRPGTRPHVEGVIASVPRVTVQPRNATGALVTTVTRLFQETGAGRRIIQRAVDTHLRRDVTQRINAALARV